MAECFALYQDGTVVRIRVMGSQRKMPSNAASGFWCFELGSIGVDGEHHVVDVKSEENEWVCCRIVEEALAEVKRVLCGVSLLGGDGVEGGEHGAVDFPCIIQQGRCKIRCTHMVKYLHVIFFSRIAYLVLF